VRVPPFEFFGIVPPGRLGLDEERDKVVAMCQTQIRQKFPIFDAGVVDDDLEEIWSVTFYIF
jgi:hypothetical protein